MKVEAQSNQPYHHCPNQRSDLGKGTAAITQVLKAEQLGHKIQLAVDPAAGWSSLNVYIVHVQT